MFIVVFRSLMMHGLFAQVLSNKDLSRAGDLFSIDDNEIEKDLSLFLDLIYGISNSDVYLTNINHQSVVEICITRITSAIRYMIILLQETCRS